MQLTKKKTAILALALIALVATVSAVTVYKMWQHEWTITIIGPVGAEAVQYSIFQDFSDKFLYEVSQTAIINYSNTDPNYAYAVRCNISITFDGTQPDDWGDTLSVDDITLHWKTWNGTAWEHDFTIGSGGLAWTLSDDGYTLSWQGDYVTYEVGESGWHEVTLTIHSSAPLGNYSGTVYVEGYPLKP
jgi:hypothetical protein